MAENHLYYGDNLDILRRYVDDDSVDLVYLDPPFKSQQDYNVLFEDRRGDLSEAQIQAFEDTWRWDLASARAYAETVEGGGDVSRVMQAFRTFLGESDMLAYLAMMAPRLVELKRALKASGSIYLHCDPTASHYLKLLMDAVMGPTQFRNEVIWKRTGSHNSAKRYGPVHDVILYYGAGRSVTWNQQFQPYDESYVSSKFSKTDPETGLAFQDVTLTGPGTRKGPSGQPWRGVDPTAKGRHWQPASYLYRKYEEITGVDLASFPFLERLDRLDEAGLIYWTRTGNPRYKQFLEDAQGAPLADVWSDIDAINSQAQERLGYPTQKPAALLERIVAASSNPGDVVLDPFCGCGTTVAAAEKLDRRWVGIDITHLAITLIKHRLRDTYGDNIDFDVHGEPTSDAGAAQLAEEDRFQFEWWALGLVGARPQEQRKGADRGIDGRLYFHDEPGGSTKQIILQVKSGKTGVKHVRDLRGVIDREDAEIGVLIALQEPTKPMRTEAASAGFYESPWGKHPRIQILTIEELLDGAQIDYPPVTGRNVTYRKAPKYTRKVAEQLDLDDGRS